MIHLKLHKYLHYNEVTKSQICSKIFTVEVDFSLTYNLRLISANYYLILSNLITKYTFIK